MMPSRSWIGLAATGCCAAAGLVVPETHKFLSEMWSSYLHETLANRLAIGLTVAATFAAPTLNLLWGLKEIDALRKDVDAADVRRKEAEGRENTANIKIRELRSEIEASAMHTPDRFLELAIIADGGKAFRPEGLSILKRGLENSAEPMANACRRLAIKLLAADGDSELAEAGRLARIAASLVPKNKEDGEIASIVVERKATAAMQDGRYKPDDPELEPIVNEITEDPEEIKNLTRELINGSLHAFNHGEYFLAERLAAKASAMANCGPETVTSFSAHWTHANALDSLGHPQEALKKIESYAPSQTRILGANHSNVFATSHLRAEVLARTGRFQEALENIDTFAADQAREIGEDRQNALATSHLRAKVLAHLGRYQEALADIDAFATRQIKALGGDHPNVLMTSHLRAEVLDHLGRPEDDRST